MKSSILMFLVLGVALIFSGCSKMDPMDIELSQNDELNGSLKSSETCNVKTEFSGICAFVAPLEEGTVKVQPNGNVLMKGISSEWYDSGSDPRVTGQSFWYVTQRVEADGMTKLWGKAELFVADDGGMWELSWHGWLTPNADGSFLIYVDATGTGKEGAVKGLVGKWVYTMDIKEGFFYSFEGYIVDK